MRDIRPGKKDQSNLPEAEPPLPSLPRKSFTSKQLLGSAVPITQIDVPPEKVIRAGTLQKRVARESRPTPPAQRVRIGHRERKVLLVLLGLLIVAALLAALIFLPRADVKLILRTAPLLVDESLTVRTGESDGEAIAGSSFFREVEVSGTSPVQSTEIIGAKARGSVTIVNRTIDEQKIKEKSRLVTKDEVLFYMQKSLTVPPNSSATVEVEAAEAGETGNITAQRLNFAALDPSSQTLVYGEATAPLTGGSGETVQVIKETDMEQAKKGAGTAAREQVEQDIRSQLPRGWVVLEESWTIEVADFETAATLGSRQTTIPYTARAVVRVIGHEKQALEDRLRIALEKRLAEDYMLFPGPISYTATVQEVNWEQSEARISTRVTHTTIPRFSLETLRGKLAGQNGNEAKKYLEGLPGVRSVTLDLSPFWVQSIPRIEKRIKLDLQPERQP